MGWIGLSDAKSGVFSSKGLTHCSRDPFDLNGLLPHGTVLIEFAYHPGLRNQNIWRYASCNPSHAGLAIDMDGAGVLRLTQWQGDEERTIAVPTGLSTRSRGVTVSYVWDAPARRAILSVEIVETGEHHWAEMADPIALTYRDALRMMADKGRCKHAPGLVFAAVADTQMPIGTLPSLAPDTLIATPKGLRYLDTLRPGEIVQTANGEQAQVRWIGDVVMPARGRYRALQMRRPYRGLTRDVVVGADQRLRLDGPEVEYLFGAEAVTAYVGHIQDGTAIKPAKSGLTVRYCQIVLDRQAQLEIGGVWFETLDIDALLRDPRLRKYSVLANVPPELLPKPAFKAPQTLHDYEAVTLFALRAA